MRCTLGAGLYAVFAMAAVAAFTLAAAPQAGAAYPEETIQLIVPWSAGGGSDTSMRLVADALSRRLPVSVVVVNKPGAGGAIGTRAIASAKADGYTIGMVGSGVVARQYSNPNANEIGDLQPIAFFGEEPSALTARADKGWQDVDDFIAAAKANPGQIRNGNDQPGGASYIAIAVMEKKLGVNVTRVPYRGFAPTVAALLAGEVDTATVPVPDVIEHHKNGTVRLLGVAGQQRHFLAPNVPTFKEQGHDVVVGLWRTIVGPRGIAQDRLDYLESKLLETLRDKDFQKRANNAGFAVSPIGRKESWTYWQSFDAQLYPVLEEAGLVKVRQK